MPRAQDPTQSLLRWGIQNAAPGSLAETAQEIKDGKRPDLSTDVLKHIMGQSDADKMRECVMVIEGTWVDRDNHGEVKNASDITDDDRYRAWEDLEMLVQDLDNANGASLAPLPFPLQRSTLTLALRSPADLQNMGLWPVILKYLSHDDDEQVMFACWVCGTATQVRCARSLLSSSLLVADLVLAALAEQPQGAKGRASTSLLSLPHEPLS